MRKTCSPRAPAMNREPPAGIETALGERYRSEAVLRASQLFFPTLREVPAEAELISHQLLLRGAFIRKVAAGVYEYLPLGYKVIKKIQQIVREETDAAGGQEVLMPTLIPAEMLRETNRWDIDVLFKLEDRSSRDMALGFTHEETVTDIARRDVRSYRELPLNLYQIQTKFRDEPRPRGGIIRTVEFIMLDSYTFDRDDRSLDRSYAKMFVTFTRAFARCGTPWVVVDAEAGAIGGRDNQEFMVAVASGEDVLFHCSTCGYAANAERAEIGPAPAEAPAEMLPLTLVQTPDMRTIDQVTAFLGAEAKDLVKTLIYLADGKPAAALVRGDRELNEAKFTRAIGAAKLEMADWETILKLTGAEVGFSGPVGLKNVRILADNEIAGMSSFVTGANRTDAHYTGVNLSRDFTVEAFADLRVASAGDPCPHCDGGLVEGRGIEVGHVFKLGTKYSEAMGAKFLDEDGTEKPFVMGCYGLGISRLPAAIVEVSHDKNGIIWPITIAPFEAVVLLLNPDDERQTFAAVRVYEELQAAGIDVLLDERDERSGVKFKDADLLGIPAQIVAGRLAAEGKVEIRLRGSEERRECALEDAAREVVNMIERERRKLDEAADEAARLAWGTFAP